MTGKKATIIAIIIGTLASVAMFAAGSVLAVEAKAYPPIVQKLAERFNLDVDDVEQVFQEERQGRHKAMRGRHKAGLNEAVKDGKITEAQKTAVLTKMDALHESRKALKGKDREARHEAMEKLHADFVQWLKANDIDPELIGPAGGGCGMMGKGMGMREGMRMRGGTHGPGSMMSL